MPNRSEQSSNEAARFNPGMPVRVKDTKGHTLNREFMPNGIVGIVDRVENGKVYVAYIVPGEGLKPGQGGKPKLFPFEPEEIEEVRE